MKYLITIDTNLWQCRIGPARDIAAYVRNQLFARWLNSGTSVPILVGTADCPAEGLYVLSNVIKSAERAGVKFAPVVDVRLVISPEEFMETFAKWKSTN